MSDTVSESDSINRQVTLNWVELGVFLYPGNILLNNDYLFSEWTFFINLTSGCNFSIFSSETFGVVFCLRTLSAL